MSAASAITCGARPEAARTARLRSSTGSEFGPVGTRPSESCAASRRRERCPRGARASSFSVPCHPSGPARAPAARRRSGPAAGPAAPPCRRRASTATPRLRRAPAPAGASRALANHRLEQRQRRVDDQLAGQWALVARRLRAPRPPPGQDLLGRHAAAPGRRAGLVHRPQVLFLDEPTTGLDPEARALMWAEIERLARQEGMTILLTTHYLEEADRLLAAGDRRPGADRR